MGILAAVTPLLRVVQHYDTPGLILKTASYTVLSSLVCRSVQGKTGEFFPIFPLSSVLVCC